MNVSNSTKLRAPTEIVAPIPFSDRGLSQLLRDLIRFVWDNKPVAVPPIFIERLSIWLCLQWKGGVLPLNFDLHTHIVESHPTDSTRWEILPNVRPGYATHWPYSAPLATLTIRANVTIPISLGSHARPQKKNASDYSTICLSFKKGIEKG